MADTSLVFSLLAKDKVTSKLKKVGAVAKASLAVAGVAAVKFGKDSISAASDLNETLSKSNVIFGKNARVVNRWASHAAANMGLSRQAALESASGFGDMFNQIGFGSKQAAKLSTGVVQMAADFGSLNNLPTADVSERIAAAFRGEYDSLQTLIPNINAARVQQVALAQSGKKNASSLTAQEKATAVLAILHRDGAKAMGNFGDTASQFANRQKTLRANLADISAEIGTRLLPVATRLTSWGVAAIAWMRQHTSLLKGIAVAAGLIAAPLLIAVGVLKAVSAATTIWSAAGKIATGVSKLWAAGQWLLNAAMSANPIALVVLAIIALIAIFVIAYKKSATFRKIVQAAFNGVKAAASAVAHFFTGVLWPAISGAFTKVMHKAGQLKDSVVSHIRGIVSFVTSLPSRFYQAGSNIISSLKDGMVRKIGEVKAWFSDQIGAIRNMLPFSPAKEGPLSGGGSPDIAGAKIGSMLAAGIKSQTGTVRSATAGLLSGATPAGPLRAPRPRGAAGGDRQVIELRMSGQGSGLERIFLSWLQGALRTNPGVRLVGS